MGEKKVRNGWFYEYETTEKYRRTYNCELTDVRYVLGEQFDESKKKVLICIGINPSTALPNFLDPTLKRVQEYAKRCGDYGAWYMLNVYPQRATNPQDMDKDESDETHTKFRMELHLNNLKAIKGVLSSIEEADVWCAWGSIMNDNQRKYLSDLFFGCRSKKIKGIVSLFCKSHSFKAYGATCKGYPKHPLLLGKNDKLKELAEIGLESLQNKIDEEIRK